MNLGLFFDLPPRPGETQNNAFQEAMEQVRIADEAKLDTVWLAERHFLPHRAVLSSPLVVAGAVAASTTHIKIGTGVIVLPLSNPVRLAEDIATLDHLSGGRLEFGIGRSSGQSAYLSYNIPYAESRARFTECLDIIKLAWTQENFSYQGQFYKFNDVCIVPKPLQQPYPPMRIAITSPGSYAEAGAMGLPIFFGLSDAPEELKERVEIYKTAWNEAGHPGSPSAYARLAVHCAETMQDAMEVPKESAINFFTNLIAGQNYAISGLSEEENQRLVSRGQKLRSMTYDDILRDHVVFGTPEFAAERLLKIQEYLGIDGFIADVNFGGQIPREHLNKSLRLFAERVAPLVKSH